MRRHQPHFHATTGAEPRHRHATRAQRMRDRKAGEDVSARAARKNHHGSRRIAHAPLPMPSVGSMRGRRRLVPRAALPAGATGGCVVGAMLPSEG